MSATRTKEQDHDCMWFFVQNEFGQLSWKLDGPPNTQQAIQFVACKRRHEEHIEVSGMMHKTDLQIGKFAGRRSSIPYSPPRDNNNSLAKNNKR